MTSQYENATIIRATSRLHPHVLEICLLDVKRILHSAIGYLLQMSHALMSRG